MTEKIEYSLLITGVCLIVVALIIPLVKKIALHINAMDIPNERKVHSSPIPRLGGLGIFMGFLFGYMIFAKSTVQMNSILIGSFIIILTGIIDDIKPISARYKLLGQILASCVIVFYGNILLNNVTILGLDLNFGVLSYPITILFIVACTNIINLIDGLDGLSGGISSIFYLSTIVICFFQNRYMELEFVMSLLMLGSTLGFLIHNFHPARIFAGDSGALFMGFTIAVISLLGFKTTAITSIFIPLMILAVPILDTLFAIVRRLIKGKSLKAVIMPDRGHLHHKLIDKGYSQKQAVLIMYGISATLGMFAVILLESGIWKALSFALMICVAIAIGYHSMFKIKDEK